TQRSLRYPLLPAVRLPPHESEAARRAFDDHYEGFCLLRIAPIAPSITSLVGLVEYLQPLIRMVGMLVIDILEPKASPAVIPASDAWPLAQRWNDPVSTMPASLAYSLQDFSPNESCFSYTTSDRKSVV